jgi:hypothetical protein
MFIDPYRSTDLLLACSCQLPAKIRVDPGMPLHNTLYNHHNQHNQPLILFLQQNTTKHNKTITTTPKFINKPDPKLSQLTSSPTPQLWHTLLQAHRVVRQYLSVCQVRKSK